MSILIILYVIEASILGLFKDAVSSINILSAILIVVFSFVYISTVRNNTYYSDYADLLTTGYLFRILLLFFDIYGTNIYILPNSGADSVKYYRNAVWFSEHGELLTGGGEFSRLMGSLMKIIGTGRLFSQFTVMLFSIISLFYFVKAISLYETDNYISKYKSVRYLCLLPNFAILSSIFLRESIVTMLISISLYWFVNWMMNGRIHHFILAFIFSLAGAVFHSGSIAVAIGYIVAYLFFDRINQRVNIRVNNVVVGILFLGITIFLYTRYGDIFFAKMENIEEITDIANVNVAGGSSYTEFVGDSKSVGSMVIFTIPRIVYFLFSPFPWQWRGGSDVIAFIFSSLFYALSIVMSIRAILKRNAFKSQIILLTIVAVIATFVFAWGVSNTGTAIRHRDKLITIYGLLYMLSAFREEDYEIEEYE